MSSAAVAHAYISAADVPDSGYSLRAERTLRYLFTESSSGGFGSDFLSNRRAPAVAWSHSGCLVKSIGWT
jgi:hypothetical protein